MDLSKIKNLIKRNGDKIIMVENGEPELVVMSFKEYEKMADTGMPSGSSRPSSFNRPVLSDKVGLGDGLEKETEVVVTQTADYQPHRPMRLEDIRLEDLPL